MKITIKNGFFEEKDAEKIRQKYENLLTVAAIIAVSTIIQYIMPNKITATINVITSTLIIMTLLLFTISKKRRNKTK